MNYLFCNISKSKVRQQGSVFFSLKHTLIKVLQCLGVNSVLTTHLPRQLYLGT